MQIDLRGRVALVTGAAQGIGASTARQLAACGAHVAVVDIQEDAGRAVTDDINASDGGRALFIPADVGHEAQIRYMVAKTVERFGRLDILVNNAHFEVAGAITELSADDWDRSYAVLLRGPFLAAKYAIPHMRAAGGGSIINISSVLGHYLTTDYATYTTAKAALVQLSRQIALDYGPHGIRCNTISPGYINTRIKDGEYVVDSVTAQVTPLRREGVPQDIAAAICFLVSDWASFITGAHLVIDGGITIPFFSVFRDRLAALGREP